MVQRPRVTVLGSMNMDISVTVPRLAGRGETVLGSAARLLPGGKGGNCALAAARLGAAVRMVGCCGQDGFGTTLTSALREGGVDVTGVRTIAGTSSGIALITVDAAGENSITVAPGANGLAGEPEVATAFAAPTDVLVLSAEIPVPVLAAALDQARAARVTSVLNLAPVPADPRPLIEPGVDWLVVNAPEAGVVLGRQVACPSAAESAAAELARAGARQVAVTMGPGGAVYSTPDGPGAVPGFRVHAVDSVGAGDAFVAALAVAVAAGTPPPESVRLACAVGATAVTRPGAQEGLPTGADVLAATGVRWPLTQRPRGDR
jgi:ribokinase